MLAGGTGAGGRPVEEFRRQCREAIATAEGIAFVQRVMEGTETEDALVTVGSGKHALVRLEQVRPKIKDRLLAFELLADRGHGKPPQEVKLSDERPRATGEALVARLLELLPMVIPALPMDRKVLGRLLQEQRQIEVLVQGREVKPTTEEA